jgi:hypothetical protein
MMTPRLYLSVFALLSALSVAQAQTAPPEPMGIDVPPPDRIAFTAHHALFDALGRRVEPSIEELESWLNRQFGAARNALDDEGQRRLEEMLEAARELDLADPVIQSIILEALAIEERLPSSVYLGEVNHTVRLEWFRQTLDRKTFRRGIDAIHALPLDMRPKLLDLGLVGESQQALRDIPEGGDYLALCREEGVPPPPNWDSPSGMSRGDWDFEGNLETNFLTLGDPTEVWSFRSNSPAGTCIALPRFDSEDWIGANGIICLGTETGNACFYDRADLDANQSYGIDEFASGGFPVRRMALRMVRRWRMQATMASFFGFPVATSRV